jgi:hypothetical protein
VRWQIKLTSSVFGAVAAAVESPSKAERRSTRGRRMDARLMGTPDLMVNIAITIHRSGCDKLGNTRSSLHPPNYWIRVFCS